MKIKEKIGISLIVLVITILVMIILAGVVIVSLQNDNPINKAKFAKNMDSIQSIRAAITQYTITSQSTESEAETFDDKMNKILKDPEGIYQGYEDYTKILKLDEDVKKLLGVDPSTFIGEDVGYFLINPKTGASLYKFNTPIFDEQIEISQTEGILKNNSIISKEPIKNSISQSWVIDKNLRNKMYFQFKSDKDLPKVDINIIGILKVPELEKDREAYNFKSEGSYKANKLYKIESFNLNDVKIGSENNKKNIFENMNKYKELRIQIVRRPEDKVTNYNEINFTDLVLTNTNITK